MGINEEHLRAQWHADLARIAAQIDDLKGRVYSESQELQARLSAEVAVLQSELRTMEAEVDATPDLYARHIAAQIDDLRAKGDAAYRALMAGMPAQLNPIDAEIRRLEAAAATASGSANSRIRARIDKLKALRDTEQEHAGALTIADDDADRCPPG